MRVIGLAPRQQPRQGFDGLSDQRKNASLSRWSEGAHRCDDWIVGKQAALQVQDWHRKIDCAKGTLQAWYITLKNISHYIKRCLNFGRRIVDIKR
jgi:hypothetical protein